MVQKDRPLAAVLDGYSISQGSVASRLSCGGIFNGDCRYYKFAAKSDGKKCLSVGQHLMQLRARIPGIVTFCDSDSVVMVPEFTLSVRFGCFFKEKTAVTVLVFDEWVSLPFREVLGMGDCGGDERDLLMGRQSKENN